jgi:hypothetical protein
MSCSLIKGSGCRYRKTVLPRPPLIAAVACRRWRRVICARAMAGRGRRFAAEIRRAIDAHLERRVLTRTREVLADLGAAHAGSENSVASLRRDLHTKASGGNPDGGPSDSECPTECLVCMGDIEDGDEVLPRPHLFCVRRPQGASPHALSF